ncbi:MAG: hypothetical protein QW186_08365 [Candidatus Bathyarchaeia archaeon]
MPVLFPMKSTVSLCGESRTAERMVSFILEYMLQPYTEHGQSTESIPRS